MSEVGEWVRVEGSLSEGGKNWDMGIKCEQNAFLECMNKVWDYGRELEGYREENEIT